MIFFNDQSPSINIEIYTVLLVLTLYILPLHTLTIPAMILLNPYAKLVDPVKVARKLNVPHTKADTGAHLFGANAPAQ